MARAVLTLGLVVILGVGDGGLDQVLDVSLDILPEVKHICIRSRGIILLAPAAVLKTLLGEAVTVGRGLDAVVLADVVIHLLPIVLDVSQFRLGFVRDVIMFIILGSIGQVESWGGGRGTGWTAATSSVLFL